MDERSGFIGLLLVAEMGEATKTTNHSWSSVDGLRRSIDAGMVTQRQPEWVSGEAGRYSGLAISATMTPTCNGGVRVTSVACLHFHAARQNSELGDGDSLPGGRLSPPASAINSREGGESAALDLNGVTASDAWGDNESTPRLITPTNSIRVLTLSAVMDRGETCIRQGIRDGEIVAVIILLASIRLVERYDDDLAS